MVAPQLRIVFGQTAPQTVSFNPDDGILLRVESVRTLQGFDADRIFLQLMGFPLEVAFTDVSQKAGKVGGAIEDSGIKQRLQFAALLTKLKYFQHRLRRLTQGPSSFPALSLTTVSVACTQIPGTKLGHPEMYRYESVCVCKHLGLTATLTPR